jgi:hypothetical protein
VDLRWPPSIESRAGANCGAHPHRRQFLKGIGVVQSPATASHRPTTSTGLSAMTPSTFIVVAFHPHLVPLLTLALPVHACCRRVAGKQRGQALGDGRGRPLGVQWLHRFSCGGGLG